MKRLLYYVLLWVEVKLVYVLVQSKLRCPEEIAPVLEVIRRAIRSILSVMGEGGQMWSHFPSILQ